ncbi:MAG: type III-B CRISPR module RAMP protein Cmr6 [Synergistales bacterium]|nr:type III-B CRISPR module RAMP protein Cmr6 [Synergistales bacterium]
MTSPACRSALQGVDRGKAEHAGLLLQRYLREPYKDEGHPEERQKLYAAARKAAAASRGGLYADAFERWKEALQSQSALYGNLHIQEGRMVIGLGGENVLEAGLTLHHTYGVPFIPGSALKGLAAHYCHTVWGRAGDKEADEEAARFRMGGDYHRILFGDTDDAGHITFHDAWLTPTGGKQDSGLRPDVMTPHHPGYYSSGGREGAPADSDSPNPVAFLAVQGNFLTAVSCDDPEADEWAQLAFDLLAQAVAEWGIGGKTSSGYGRGELKVDVEVEKAQRSVTINGGSYREGDTLEIPCIKVNKKGNPQFKVQGETEAWNIDLPEGEGKPRDLKKGDMVPVRLVQIADNLLTISFQPYYDNS